MGKVKFIVETEKTAKDEPPSFVLLLFLLIGVYGILQFFGPISGITYSKGSIYVISALVCTVMWYLWFYKRKYFLFVLLFLSAVLSITVFLRWKILWKEFLQIIKSISGVSELEVMSVTELLMVTAIFLSLFFFVFEIILKNHVILYLFTSALLLFMPIYHISAEIEMVVLLSFFQIIFWMLHLSGKEKIENTSEVRHLRFADIAHLSKKEKIENTSEVRHLHFADIAHLSKKEKIKDTSEVKHPCFFDTSYLSGKEIKSLFWGRKSIWVTVTVLTLCLLLAFPLTSQYSQELYDAASAMEGYVYRFVNRASGHSEDTTANGKINRGNNYKTGAKRLELIISKKPTENLYLRGFSGGDYIGGDWTSANDETVFVRMEETLNWERWSYMIESLYSSMYFVLNNNTKHEEIPSPFILTIRHLNGRYENIYTPYYSQPEYQYTRYLKEYVVDLGKYINQYLYSYYEQKDMEIQWEHILVRLEMMKGWYRDLQETYMEEIQTAYTRVPKERLPRLTALVKENPYKDLNEISAFILYTLHSNASYTLTPGWAPLNEDIAEYFLFESGRGYCEHFALTATLLYRLYGIPARYASGYMVSPSNFELQEDGSYLAVVTDESAHAWTEIFLEDYGWTPIEVTPALDGSTVANYPGFNGKVFHQLLTKQKFDISIPSLKKSVEVSKNKSDIKEDKPSEQKFDFKKYEKVLWVIGSIFFYSIFLLPFFLDYRRLRLLRKLETVNCRIVFSKLIEMLHFGGYLLQYNGSEEEFSLKFAEEIPFIPQKDIWKLWNIVCEAAYGNGTITVEKEEFVRRIYFQTADCIYKTLKWHKKLLFRYGKVFG